MLINYTIQIAILCACGSGTTLQTAQKFKQKIKRPRPSFSITISMYCTYMNNAKCKVEERNDSKRNKITRQHLTNASEFFGECQQTPKATPPTISYNIYTHIFTRTRTSTSHSYDTIRNTIFGMQKTTKYRRVCRFSLLPSPILICHFFDCCCCCYGVLPF